MQLKQPDFSVLKEKKFEEQKTHRKKQIVVSVQKDSEISPQFMQNFLKYVINSNNFKAEEYYKDSQVVDYEDFEAKLKTNSSIEKNMSLSAQGLHGQAQYLTISQLKNNTYFDRNFPTNENAFNQTQYIFKPQAFNIIVLLDLSPYMLSYDYSTKSFPIKILYEVVKNLVSKLYQKKKSEPTSSYKLSFFAFSLYGPTIQPILLKVDIIEQNQKFQQETKPFILKKQIRKKIGKKIMPTSQENQSDDFHEIAHNQNNENKANDKKNTNILNNQEKIISYVISWIQQYSSTFLSKSPKKTIAEVIQKVIDQFEMDMGGKCLITASLFALEKLLPEVFYINDWFTFGFIITGQNLGYYMIDQTELGNIFTTSKYFVTKFIFRTQFIENWQRQKYLPNIGKSTSRNRLLALFYKNQVCKNIFDYLLSFRFCMPQKKNKPDKTVNTQIKHKPTSTVIKESYTIPSGSILAILKLRSQQGWEPNYFQKDKYCFKLYLNKRQHMLYTAEKKFKDQYAITISEVYRETRKRQQNIDFDMIRTIDIINASTIEILKKFESLSKVQKRIFSPKKHSVFDKKQINLSLINSKHQQWQKFFKVKRIYVRFSPIRSEKLFKEFISQFSYCFGQKITDLFYMKKMKQEEIKLKKIESDIDGYESSNYPNQYNPNIKIIFVKLKPCGSVLQIKFGFSKFASQKINEVISEFKKKINGKIFKDGYVHVVQQPLFRYFELKQLKVCQPYKFQWDIKFNTQSTFNIICNGQNSYFKKMLQMNKFKQIQDLQQTHYYKIIEFNQSQKQMEYVRKEVYIFLNININIQSYIVHMQVSTTPQFCQVIRKRQTMSMYYSPRRQDLINQNKINLPNILIKASSSMQVTDIDFGTSHKQQNKTQITYAELFWKVCDNLKTQQMKIIKMFEFYEDIHMKMLASIVRRRPIGASLENYLKELYGFRGTNFPQQFQNKCKKIMDKYYSKNRQSKSTIFDIPPPKSFLMKTQLEINELSADLTLSKDNKKYAFFLLSPSTFIYLQKNNDCFLYKFIYMFNEIDPREQHIDCKNLMIEQIKNIVEKQQYNKQYQLFPQNSNPNFKLKNPSHYLMHIGQFPVIKKDDTPKEKQKRILSRIDKFAQIMFKLVKIFFRITEVQKDIYCFEINYDRMRKNNFPAWIEPEKMKNYDRIIMKMSIKYRETKQIQLIPCNLANLSKFFKNIYEKGINGRYEIDFQFYTIASSIANSQNVLNYPKVIHFSDLLKQLQREFIMELVRLSIVSESDFSILNNYNRQIGLIQTSYPTKDFNKQKISKTIQSPALMKIIPFKKMPTDPWKYICCQQLQSGILQITDYITLQISPESLDFSYINRKFFPRQNSPLKTQQNNKLKEQYKKIIEQYSTALQNSITLSKLLEECSQSKDIPQQLFINQYVHKAQNKIKGVQMKQTKKKITKAHLTKFKKFFNQAKSEQEQQNNNNELQEKKTYPLPCILINFVRINPKLKNRSNVLQAINNYTPLRINKLTKYHQTFLFSNLIGKDTFIIHFQQLPKSKLQELSKQLYKNGQQFKNLGYQQRQERQQRKQQKKQQRFLVYFVHALSNASLKTQQSVDAFVKRLVNEALNAKLFDIMSEDMFRKPDIIDPIEYKFLTTGQKKNFNPIQLPNIEHQDIFMCYLKQHIQVYHSKTKLQSLAKYQQEFHDSMRDIIQKSQSLSRISSSINDSFNLNQGKGGAQSRVSQSFRSTSFRKQHKSTEPLDLLGLDLYIFNYIKSQILKAKFGRCLYLFTIQLRKIEEIHQKWQYKSEEKKKLKVFQGSNLNEKKICVLPCDIHNKIDITEDFLKRKKESIEDLNNKKPKQKYLLNFQIHCCVGTALFDQIQRGFKALVQYALEDYYIQNKIFGEILENKSDQSLTTEIESEFQNASDCKKIGKKLLGLQKYEYLTQKKGGLSSFYYHTNGNILLRSSKQLLQDFLDKLPHLIEEGVQISPQNDIKKQTQEIIQKVKQYPKIFYGENCNGKKTFWETIVGKNIEQYSKIGFFLVDNYEDNLHNLKQFKHQKLTVDQRRVYDSDQTTFEKNEKEKSYYFCRSLVIHFEIASSSIKFMAYNMTLECNLKIKDYLATLQNWLKEKYNLYKFIENIKTKSRYQQPVPQRHNEFQLGFIQKIYEEQYRIQQKKFGEKQTDNNTNLTKLLKNLIMSDLPKCSLGNVDQMYKTLVTKKIKYSDYGELKKRFSCSLQQLGWEYMSILRSEFKRQQNQKQEKFQN